MTAFDNIAHLDPCAAADADAAEVKQFMRVGSSRTVTGIIRRVVPDIASYLEIDA